jgi:F-type H+-transporting ATPase subunit gamma
VLSSLDLEKKIEGFSAIDDIVGVMKAYAGVTMRKTENLVQNVRRYERNVLSVMADVYALHPASVPEKAAGGKRVVVAFGSSQGLCGAYNERIADNVVAYTSADDTFYIIGKRLREALATRGTACSACRDSVGSINGIKAALQSTVADLWKIYAKEEYYTLTLFFMSITENQPVFTVERVLPPDMDCVRSLRSMSIPPLSYLTPQMVFVRTLEEFLFISLYRCCLESLRSESWFRLRRMEGASENLKRRLADLGSLRKYVRQEEITEEMLEILGSGELSRMQAD